MRRKLLKKRRNSNCFASKGTRKRRNGEQSRMQISRQRDKSSRRKVHDQAVEQLVTRQTKTRATRRMTMMTWMRKLIRMRKMMTMNRTSIWFCIIRIRATAISQGVHGEAPIGYDARAFIIEPTSHR